MKLIRRNQPYRNGGGRGRGKERGRCEQNIFIQLNNSTANIHGEKRLEYERPMKKKGRKRGGGEALLPRNDQAKGKEKKKKALEVRKGEGEGDFPVIFLRTKYPIYSMARREKKKRKKKNIAEEGGRGKKDNQYIVLSQERGGT